MRDLDSVSGPHQTWQVVHQIDLKVTVQRIVQQGMHKITLIMLLSNGYEYGILTESVSIP